MIVSVGNSLSSKKPSWMKILSASFWGATAFGAGPAPPKEADQSMTAVRPPFFSVLKISFAKAVLSPIWNKILEAMAKSSVPLVPVSSLPCFQCPPK